MMFIFFRSYSPILLCIVAYWHWHNEQNIAAHGESNYDSSRLLAAHFFDDGCSRTLPENHESSQDKVDAKECFASLFHRWYDTNQRWMTRRTRTRTRIYLLHNCHDDDFHRIKLFDQLFSFISTYNVVNATWGLTKTLTDIGVYVVRFGDGFNFNKYYDYISVDIDFLSFFFSMEINNGVE